MSYSAIMKETGRATHDELRRLRQRLEFVEQYRGAIEQSLVRSQNEQGPAGQDLTGEYLKLDASNDPVTGPLALSSTLNVTGAVDFASTLQVDGLATFSNTIYAHNANGTAIDARNTGTDPAVKITVGGANPPTLSPGSITNVANNLLMWFEADTLGLSDGNDVQTWTQSGAGLSSDMLLQGTASIAPHYRTGETPTGKPGVIAETIGHRMSKQEADGIDWRYGSDQGGGTDRNSAFIVVYRTDNSALSNNILTMGNEDSSGQKHSFRPVGNSALGNSYIYSGNTLVQVGGGHAGHSGGTWHIALFWYDASDDSNRVWIDGVNYDVPTTFDMQVDVDALFRDEGGGTENVNVGTGVAAMVLVGNNSTGAEPTLSEMQQVHDFLALEYMGLAYTIAGGSSAGDLIQMCDSTGVVTVFDEQGWLHIGGSNPLFPLDVEGDADIRDALSCGTLAVDGIVTISGATVNVATGNLVFASDNAGVVLGAGSDARIDYDGTDLVVDPKVVGSGHVRIAGTLEKEELVLTKSADYTMQPEDNYVLVSATAVITLPAVASNSQHTVKNIGSATVVSLVPASGTIDGLSTVTIATQYDAIKVVSDGTNWWIV